MSALKKTTLEEWGGVYVGVRAQPLPPHIPVLFSRLTFLQWSHLWVRSIRKLDKYQLHLSLRIKKAQRDFWLGT